MFRLQTQLRQFIYDVSKHFGFEVVIFSHPWFSAAPSARRGVVNLNEAFPRLVSKENELLPPFNGAIICFLKNHHAFVLATVLYLVFDYRYIVRHDCNVLRWLVKFFYPLILLASTQTYVAWYLFRSMSMCLPHHLWFSISRHLYSLSSS